MVDIIRAFENFIIGASNIKISSSVIILTAFIFLFLHGKRNHPVLAQLSIIAGFIPVLVHEIGHAMMTSLTRGYVKNIYMVLTPKGQLKSGAQGYAETAGRNWVSNIIKTFAGYAFPPLVMTAGVLLAVNGYALLFIALLVIFALYYFWHTSQKWLPILFIAILAYSGFNLITAMSEWSQSLISTGYSVIIGLLLGEVLQSIAITSRVNFSTGNKEWDGTAMRRLTYLPSTLWWMLWTILSGWSIWTVATTLA